MTTHAREISRPNFFMALLPIVLTIGLLSLQMLYYKDFTPHIPLVFGVTITCALGWLRGYRWPQLEEGLLHVVKIATPIIAILTIVGMIIAIWIASGTVPYLIYYGFKLLNPQMFLAAAMILCALVSMSLGTSWTTTATVGLALVGIGNGFDIPIYWTAGAVVSGAFFGDKMSPLSDTTNLAPAVTGTKLFEHIRNMIPTTAVAMVVAFFVYLYVGYNIIDLSHIDMAKINELSHQLESNFNLTPWVLLPIAVVIAMTIIRIPAIPSLMISALSALLITILVQDHGFHETMTYLQSGFAIETGNSAVDSLLNRGGIQSMTWTITLVLIALALGGVLEKTRCLEAIIFTLLKRVKGYAGLQTCSTLTAMATNTVAGDPYLSIALTGRMYAQAYRGMGYSTLNLSRSIEEGGTLISPLIPWNAGGAIVISSLGLAVFDGHPENLMYIVCAVACWLSPIIGLIYSYLGWFAPKASAQERERWRINNEVVMTFPNKGFSAS